MCTYEDILWSKWVLRTNLVSWIPTFVIRVTYFGIISLSQYVPESPRISYWLLFVMIQYVDICSGLGNMNTAVAVRFNELAASHPWLYIRLKLHRFLLLKVVFTCSVFPYVSNFFAKSSLQSEGVKFNILNKIILESTAFLW